MTEILYKYRSLDNFKNFVDIILNNRLFAAKYDELNDPMEGHYLYSIGELNTNILNRIYDEKQSIRICSLSKNNDNFLMWSHYANGHKGVAIGLRIDEQAYRVRDIQYLPNLISIEDENNIDTMSILCSKINLWSYENEVRAFTTDNSFYINVVVEEIYLGSRMSNQDISFVRNLVDKINPNIRVIRARN
ncbi:DUF2971 domain-containing protein [Myroides odoratimimus]|uniref:DUF2971 domain-containing protein n=1 Tax=Myroides odoratimimus TaxID=76832 RepID=UPI0038D358F8